MKDDWVTGHRLLALIPEEPNDEIWQEAIRVSDHIEAHFEQVFEVTMQALAKAQAHDTISALSTCLVEHLLEHDFSCFDDIERRIAEGDDKILYALSLCWKFGMSKIAENADRWDRVIEQNEARRERASRQFPSD